MRAEGHTKFKHQQSSSAGSSASRFRELRKRGTTADMSVSICWASGGVPCSAASFSANASVSRFEGPGGHAHTSWCVCRCTAPNTSACCPNCSRSTCLRSNHNTMLFCGNDSVSGVHVVPFHEARGGLHFRDDLRRFTQKPLASALVRIKRFRCDLLQLFLYNRVQYSRVQRST